MLPPQAGLAPGAEELAHRLLVGTGDRWRHTVGVAARAGALAHALDLDADLLLAAGWLHDIGYADAAVVTGFHPLDGAGYLAARGWPGPIVGLVAHHSGARFLAAARGLADELAAYPDEGGLPSDVLTYADQTIGPGGESISISRRHTEMLRRHGPDSWHAKVDHVRWPHLRAVAARVEDHLRNPHDELIPTSMFNSEPKQLITDALDGTAGTSTAAANA
jgi:putative nucleotidyltransferase with HDIG domain